MQTLLAIDVAAARCAAVVLSGDEVLAEVAEPMDRGHAERLLPVVAEALRRARVSRPDAVAVVTGPGGFTGARIGVAAARGLALGWAAPAVGVDWFEALAAGRPGLVRVAAPGRPGWTHLRLFRDGAPVGQVETAPADAPAPLDGAEMVVWTDAAWPGAIARCARVLLARGEVARPAPLYLRPPDAAPAIPATAALRA